MNVVNPTVDLIADTIMDNVERAAASSHRPEHLRRLFIDANARYVMAIEIAKALGLPHRQQLDERHAFVDPECPSWRPTSTTPEGAS